LPLPNYAGCVEEAGIKDISQLRSPNSKLIYLIQDAHTNSSGQKNVYQILDFLLDREKNIHSIYTEAAEGDNSLTSLGQSLPSAEREQIAKKYLYQGLLHGAEYLNLVSKHHFNLSGVEDPALYNAALETYRNP